MMLPISAQSFCSFRNSLGRYSQFRILVLRYWYACSFRLSLVCDSVSFIFCTTPIPFFLCNEKGFFSYNTLERMLFLLQKHSCILAAIQVVFQSYYFIIGQLLQYFFSNFGAFSVFANFYVLFFAKINNGFCACSQCRFFWPGSFASNAKICYNE